jgi:hypothetical protein
MDHGQRWPITGDRYDPYDPDHPMWTDPFWAAYCANPQAATVSPGPALQLGDGPLSPGSTLQSPA